MCLGFWLLYLSTTSLHRGLYNGHKRRTAISLSHPAQVLRIHLSSEEDLFLLHTLEFSEEEFQALKAEQGILVDFGNFPGKIIGLLERCIASSHQEAPRYDMRYKFLETPCLLCL